MTPVHVQPGATNMQCERGVARQPTWHLRTACAGLIALAVLALTTRPILAADATVTLSIAEQPRLAVGDVAAIEVTVKFRAGREQPLMLTPSIEGEAVDVVRGRLLRDDARREANGELRFRIPLTTRRPGAARLRVELATYACDPNCQPIRLFATRMLEVTPHPR